MSHEATGTGTMERGNVNIFFKKYIDRYIFRILNLFSKCISPHFIFLLIRKKYMHVQACVHALKHARTRIRAHQWGPSAVTDVFHCFNYYWHQHQRCAALKQLQVFAYKLLTKHHIKVYALHLCSRMRKCSPPMPLFRCRLLCNCNAYDFLLMRRKKANNKRTCSCTLSGLIQLRICVRIYDYTRSNIYDWYIIISIIYKLYSI